MGVRLYNPTLGRFLTTDPVVGGNANPYDYCTGDPINCTDLDGRSPTCISGSSVQLAQTRWLMSFVVTSVRRRWWSG